MSPTLPAAYTPLESLLLFQALRADGFDSLSFQKVSRDLQAIPLVTKDESYDPTRLGPDALKELYLGLLKEEVKRDLDKAAATNSDHAATNGDSSPGSRKRKAPSPSLPTVRDAAQHAHLIPQLVMRLYARYRENAVKEIRVHEHDHNVALAKATDEGNSTGVQAQPVVATRTESPKPPTAHDNNVLRDHAQLRASANASPSSPRPPVESTTQAPSQTHQKRYSQAKIDAVINHGPEPQDDHSAHRRTSSNTALPPLSEMAPQSPRFGIPPKYHANHGMQPSPPAGHPAPYPPHNAHQTSSAVSSPRIPNASNRASSSPRPLLPPPPGMKMSPHPGPLPGSPSMHHGPPPNMPPQAQYPQQQAPYSPQHRFQQGVVTPTPDRQQRPYPPQHQPMAQGYYQQQPYADRRTPYQNPPPGPAGHPAHVYPGQPPHNGGYMLPPFQVAPQDPAKMPHQQDLSQQQASRGQQTPTYAARPQYHPYQQPVAPATAPRLGPPQNRKLLSDIISKLSTPPQPTRKRLWKSEKKPQPPSFQTPGSPKRPDREIEPLSPPKPRAATPARPTRPLQENLPELKEPAPSQPKRGVRKSNRQARESSVASSAMEGSLRATRSQSVSSIPASEDRPLSRRRVKNEPSTPADTLNDVEDSDRLSVTGHRTRTRRGTITQHPPASKRKRQQSQEEEEEEQTPDATARKTTITATRNFAKMTTTIMSDISGHKHGNRFLAPVRDKDAGGYSEIIKKPRDLKSIRSAITAGTRALNAATATSSLEDSPTGMPAKVVDGSSMTVELERSADLMPPKAIVNGAQLEREVLHMLANAVMFNPGEDGMVADTREMFDDVETRIRDWRGAERDLSVNEEVEDEGKKKRRKL